MYTDEPEVISLAVKTIPFMTTFEYFDLNNGVFQGITRGLSLQGRIPLLMVFWYYIVALPAIYIFVFKLEFMLIGLWGGLGIGCFGMFISNLALIKFSDWNKIACETQKRNLKK